MYLIVSISGPCLTFSIKTM